MNVRQAHVHAHVDAQIRRTLPIHKHTGLQRLHTHSTARCRMRGQMRTRCGASPAPPGASHVRPDPPGRKPAQPGVTNVLRYLFFNNQSESKKSLLAVRLDMPCENRALLDHCYIGHNHVPCHNYIGHDYTGHNFIGHNARRT